MLPSARSRGTRNSPSPRVPVAGSATRAVIRKTSASALEQNHFSPRMVHALPGAPASGESRSTGVATMALAPTSDPPCTSVRNCEAVKLVS